MLITENVESGYGCTAEQLEYSKIVDTVEYSSVRSGKIRRQCLQIAATPKPQRIIEPGRSVRYVRGRLESNKPIVDGKLVDIYLMFDQPTKRERHARFSMSTMVYGESGYLYRSGSPAVGGRPSTNFLEINFSKRPYQPCPTGELRLVSCDSLRSLRGGTVVVRAVGEYVDICVGIYNKRPILNYRLHRRDFEGDNPAARLAFGELPAVDCEVRLRGVAKGDLLIEVSRSIESWRAALTSDGAPKLQERSKGVLQTRRRFDFRVFNCMNSLMQRASFPAEGHIPVLEESQQWEFGVLLQFDNLDVLSKASPDKELYATPQLQRDLLAAVGPQGLERPGRKPFELKILATTNSVVKRVVRHEDKNIATVTYENGKQQQTSAWAELYLLPGKELEPGCEVKVGMPIGDYCPRTRLENWSQLKWLLGDHLEELKWKFLESVAVPSGTAGFTGPGILLDSQYVGTFATHLAAKNQAGETNWYWDFRRAIAAGCFDEEMGCIFAKPMRYPDSRVHNMTMRGVYWFIGSPAARERKPRAAKKGRQQATT